jgi:hypothetical protein
LKNQSEVKMMRSVLLAALFVGASAATAALEMPEDHVVVDISTGGRRLTRGSDCHKGCPKDDSYDPKCLASAMPPYPICTRQTPAEWVKKAIDGASRCCGDDLSDCKCPVKESDHFLSKIGAHCDGIEICKLQVMAMELEGVDGASMERLEMANNGPN